MRAADSAGFYWLHSAGRGIGLEPKSGPLLDSRAVIRGQALPTEPIRFVHNIGSVPGDLIMCADPDLFLISDLFQSVLRDGNFTGWTTYPVEATGKRSEPILGYVGLAIIGRAGLPRWDLSESITMRHAPHLPDVPALRGSTFDADTWDGSDVFLLGDTGWKVVTAAVHDALRAARVRNVALTRMSELEVSASLIGDG